MRPDLRQGFALRVALGQIATVRGRRGPQTVPQGGILGVGEPTGIDSLQLRALSDQRLGALRYRVGAAERQ